MMNLTLHSTLLSLPLFQGLAKSDLDEIARKARLDFRTITAGREFIAQDSACEGFTFVISGEYTSRKTAAGGKYTLTEEFRAPQIIEPESAFGMSTRYTRSYTATSKVNLLMLDKRDVLERFLGYSVFRINLINMLSLHAQTIAKRNEWNTGQNLTEQVKRFFLVNSRYPAGRKVLRIKMEDFAPLLQTTRINISRTLNNLDKSGLLSLHRGEIIVPALEQLLIL